MKIEPPGWDKSIYKKQIRITEENHKYIDETKGRLKMATRLNEIINSYKKNGGK